jgi:hypothetical protein
MTDTVTLEQFHAGVVRVTLAPGYVYDVPIAAIVESRVAHLEQCGVDLAEATSDTWLLFYDCPRELDDWRRGDMNWDDVKDRAVRVSRYVPKPDLEEGWVNGAVEVLAQDAGRAVVLYRHDE